MIKKDNPFLGLAGNDPVKKEALVRTGRAFEAGWNHAAANIIDSPLGREYQKMGVHPDQVVKFYEDNQAWKADGSIPEAEPKPSDYKDSLVPAYPSASGPNPPSVQ